MKGKIISVEVKPGYSGPCNCIIKGEDNREYLAHIGDFKVNEDYIYKHNQVTLTIGDQVEFAPFHNVRERAISVKKL